jgi:hypothetical protein
MPLVFISHAHSDKALARGLCALLRDALALGPDDFFVSSEEGRGVAPAANIQQSVLAALSAASTLIVLLTPKSALSRWVWLEAGSRLGQPQLANPIFVCPSARFSPLLGPSGDQKALNLDNENELVELVNAVARILQRTPRDFLSYKPALSELAALATREYSIVRERRDAAVSWLRRHWATAVLAPALALLAFWHLDVRDDLEAKNAEIVRLNAAWNAQSDAIVSQYLILTGTVESQGDNQPVADALVMATRTQDVTDRAECVEPECTLWTTGNDGKFSIDLTRIRAEKEQRIKLIVLKPGFAPNRTLIKIDVRAMDAGVEPQNVKLSLAGQPVLLGSPQ